MAEPDFFANIALNSNKTLKDSLAEIRPQEYETRYFYSSRLAAPKIARKSYRENLLQFREELSKLKEAYLPFMENNVPPSMRLRSGVEIGRFKFRYETSVDRDFISVLEGKSDWEDIEVPDYRGPVGKEGKWTAFYRAEFSYDTVGGSKHIFLVCKGIDYIVNIYLNNRFVGSHEGFFSPFEFEITNLMKENNVIIFEVKNDYPTLGVGGGPLDGDKLYAATGPGWDDPLVGWHHCPPGGGIYNKVIIEERSGIFISDMFARPDIDDGSAEIWMEITNATKEIHNNLVVGLSVFTRNFSGESIGPIESKIEYAGPGVNYYRFKVAMPSFRLWEPTAPWLYTIRAVIISGNQVIDEKDRNFGMRKFHMDEDSELKGSLYLNNKPVILRGANEMGHLQQCVMKDDFDQLVEDILIAKLANMNYFRITQRPVQEEIYDYFDMLGMMHQCDFPLFGYLRRNKFSEAVEQSGEMERLIRSHPSSVMATFINEPMPMVKAENENEKLYVAYKNKGHRHLYRDELEVFFKAARNAIYIENPDRVIKNVEGDYDPPTEDGLSDFHCYTLWYTNHAVPMGKLYKGYLPEMKKGWKTGCGEYGCEGLDNYEVMTGYYPVNWIPENDSSIWNPDSIIMSQTYSMHGDWYEEQDNIRGWIEKSQKHQEFATKIMTDAFRRRSDLIVSTALHILIDAWPAGWMKAVVGVDRVPKPAYFAFRECLAPVRINLRCDRWKAYSGESLDVEAWVLNDSYYSLTDYRIVVTLRDNEMDYKCYEIVCTVKAVASELEGVIKVKMPDFSGRKNCFLDAILLDADNNAVNGERFEIEVFGEEASTCCGKIAFIGKKAESILNVLHLPAFDFTCRKRSFDTIMISSVEGFENCKDAVMFSVKNGAKSVFIPDDHGGFEWKIDGNVFSAVKMNGVFFVAFDKSLPIMNGFESDDFSYWYNAEKDYIDVIAHSYITGEFLEPLLFTYQKPGFNESVRQCKEKLPVVAMRKIEGGEIFFVNLEMQGRIGNNPILDRFMQKIAGC